LQLAHLPVQPKNSCSRVRGDRINSALPQDFAVSTNVRRSAEAYRCLRALKIRSDVEP
jgi:hypothetical protein